jgi:ADP-ribosyl-[dinitrogen reductase] hydrolase
MRIFDLALRQGRLTHWDPVAAQCTIILATIIEESIFASSGNSEDYRYCDFGSIIDNSSIHAAQAVEALMSKDEVDGFFNTLRFVTTWKPEIGGPTNGKAISCLAQAVWSVKTSESFEEAVVKAINLGGDTDTVAAVAGSIAGARWGIDGIPARWTTAVNGSAPIMSDGGTAWTNFDYQSLMDFSLATLGEESTLTPFESEKGPKRVDDNYQIYAANLNGVANSDEDDFAVVSLCRTNRLTDKFANKRNFYIIDTAGANDHLQLTVSEAISTIDTWLSEGKKVVVHCHAGRSRTGFILRAWYMNKYNATAAESLEWLASRWPAFDPHGNIDFSEFLGCNAAPDDIFDL